jgi:hypothetical protein
MSARARVWIIVALAAAAAAGTVVGVTLATRNDVQRQSSKPPPFAPDPTAPPEVAQQVREALQAWPSGTARRLRILAERYPHSALVQLELGLALALSGQQPFVPSFSRVTNAVESLLLQGAAYQQGLRPVSAEREFAAAAKAAPNDPEALTAAAVGLYDKDRPALAFSRLGPLARRFPKAQTVRFHLGLLLIYFGDMPRARRELALARAQGPRTALGKRADTLLKAGRNP